MLTMLTCSTRPLRTALVAVFALVALASCAQAGDAKATPAGGTAAPSPPLEGRRVDVTASNEGYSPSTVEAKKGESLVLRFTRTSKGECLAQVVFPDLHITKDLPLNQPVEIGIKADKPGKIAFQCGMAMVHGTVNVNDG